MLILHALAFAGSNWTNLGPEKGWMVVQTKGFTQTGNIEEVFIGHDWKAACPMIGTTTEKSTFTVIVSAFGHEDADFLVDAGVTLTPGEPRKEVDPLGYCVARQVLALEWSFVGYEALPRFENAATVAVHYSYTNPIDKER